MSAQPRRLDEVPWLEVAAQILSGFFVGLALLLLGNTIRAGADGLASIDDIHD